MCQRSLSLLSVGTTHPCVNNNGGCPFFCLMLNPTSWKCACPDDMEDQCFETCKCVCVCVCGCVCVCVGVYVVVCVYVYVFLSHYVCAWP